MNCMIPLKKNLFTFYKIKIKNRKNNPIKLRLESYRYDSDKQSDEKLDEQPDEQLDEQPDTVNMADL